MRYGLIGEKLGHSWSKIIHEAFGLYGYGLKELAPEELEGFLCAREFSGINVTIPYKKTVMPLLDEIAEDAESVGAVNTVVNRGGRLIGHNTDRGGFISMLRAGGIDPAGKKALILGTGGASLAVKAGLEAMGAAEIVFVSRSGGQPPDNAVSGKSETAAWPIVSYERARTDHTDAQIIVNATPVGMYPHTDASPLDLTPFTACGAVADIIYNPSVTKLCAQASALGMKAVTGLDMLIAQAVEAAGYFLDREPDQAWFRAAKEAVEAQLGRSGIPKICVPITGRTSAEIIAAAKESVNWPCDVIEWRADRFEEFRDPKRVGQALLKLAAVYEDLAPEKELLFTVRTASDGGEEIGRDAYEELCSMAAGHADLIDAEMNAGEEVTARIIEKAHAAGSRVIVSYHDFEKTPAEDELISRMRAMQETGADIVKVAVMPRSEKDVDLLMSATRKMKDQYARVPLVTMSMGEIGCRSRVEGERFGSAMTFASVHEASAPGQIELGELRRRLEAFHEALRASKG